MLEFYVQMIHLACCGSAFLKHLLKPTLLQVLCSNSLSVLCKCCGRDSSAYLALALTFTLCWRQKNTSKVLFNPVRCFAVTGQIRHRHDISMLFRVGVGQRVQNVSWFVNKNGCKIDSSMLWDWRDGRKKTLSLWRSLITALFTLHFLF